jgi:hypothetical protein
VVSNVTVSVGHTVAKMLAVAYAESFHAGRAGHPAGSGRQGEAEGATATTTPFFDPQDMRLRA